MRKAPSKRELVHTVALGVIALLAITVMSGGGSMIGMSIAAGGAIVVGGGVYLVQKMRGCSEEKARETAMKAAVVGVSVGLVAAIGIMALTNKAALVSGLTTCALALGGGLVFAGINEYRHRHSKESKADRFKRMLQTAILCGAVMGGLFSSMPGVPGEVSSLGSVHPGWLNITVLAFIPASHMFPEKMNKLIDKVKDMKKNIPGFGS